MRIRKLIGLVVLGLALAGSLVADPAPADARPEAVESVDAVGVPAHHYSAVWPCAAHKPHTGDALYYAEWRISTTFVHKAWCMAGDDHGSGAIEYHRYTTYTYSDGSSVWVRGWD